LRKGLLGDKKGKQIMGSNESIQITGTMSDYVTQRVTDEKQGKEFSQEYLKADFFASAVDALFYARRNASLTQAQVADVLKTKQSAIARLEADTAGSMSLRRYVEFAFACGMAPLCIKLVPLNEVHDYVLDNPGAPCAFEAYNAWIAAKEQPILTVASIALPINTTAQVTSTVFTVGVQEEKSIQEALKPVHIQFSPNWHGINMTAVSSNSSTSISTTQPNSDKKAAA
jgi:transcriptional regulator with XRE-family HTH domain